MRPAARSRHGEISGDDFRPLDMSDERMAQVDLIPERVGGVGDRYTCQIQGQESYLWFEKGRWFVEKKA